MTVDLSRIARDLGVAAVRERAWPRSGSLLVRNGQSVVVIDNRHQGRRRQRFTLAHELAHLLLIQAGLDCSEEPSHNRDSTLGTGKVLEKLADRIAATLLLPAPLVQACSASQPSWQSLADLCQLFDVSVDSMGIRLIQTGTWNCALINWRWYARPASEETLRITWSAAPNHWRVFIPSHAPAPAGSSILQSFVSWKATERLEELKLGSLKGRFTVLTTTRPPSANDANTVTRSLLIRD